MNTNRKAAEIERHAIRILVGDGYVVHRTIRTPVETPSGFYSNANDFFGCIDLLAKRKGERMRYIQVTTKSVSSKVKEVREIPWDTRFESVEIWQWIGGANKREDGRNGIKKPRCYFQLHSLDHAFVTDSTQRLFMQPRRRKGGLDGLKAPLDPVPRKLVPAEDAGPALADGTVDPFHQDAGDV